MIGTDDTDSAEGRLFHFEHDRRLIIKDFCTGGEFLGCSEYGVHNLSRCAVGVLCDHVFNAAAAKRFIFWIARVNNAIAKKSEYVTRLGVNCDFVVGNIFKHA